MPITRAIYLYCLVAAARRPVVRRPRGVPGAGPIRLLALDAAATTAADSDRLKRWLVVADVPLPQYSEAAINARLNDLDWVSRAAVAHEQVVESFRGGDALLPMKLFTIFSSDERALSDLRARRRQIDRVLRRVMHHDEWGVRVVLNRDGAPAGKSRSASRRASASGVDYLQRKKAARDRVVELAARSREVTANVFDTLAARSTVARRRSAADLPAGGGMLLLDGAFLVPRAGAARFRAAAGREARALARDGYQLTLTGPWPAYSFMQE
jgi:hypothetical protein